MPKKGKIVDKKNLSDKNVTNVSSSVAKKVINDKKSPAPKDTHVEAAPFNDKKTLFSNKNVVNKKKNLIFLVSAIVFSLSLASFFVFFRDDYYADAENWPLIDKTTGLRAKPSEVLIKEGLLSKPVKILEVQFEFKDDSSGVSLYRFTKKNAYPTKSKNPIDNWKAEIKDSDDNTLSEVFFSRDEEIDDDGYNPSGIKKSTVNNIKQKTATINLLWNDTASTLKIYKPSGDLVLEQDIRNPKSIDNKQEVFGVIGRDKRSNKSSFLDKINTLSKVNAQTLDSNNGTVDIVFIAQGYTSANMGEFNTRFGEARNTILQIEPYKSRASSINFFMMPTTQDFKCTGPTTTSTRMTCGDWYQVFDAVNNAGYRFDKVFVIKKSTLHGGTSGGTWAISTSHDGPEWSSKPEIHKNTIIHELGHSFGLYDEYLATTNPGGVTNTVEANCFKGSGNSTYSFKECRYPDWYRSTLTSTMRDFPVNPFYNSASVAVVARNLDSYIDSIPPKVSFNTTSSAISIASTNYAINVTATDNLGVSKVELYADGLLNSTDTTAPYSFSLDATKIKLIGKGPILANTTLTHQIGGRGGIPLGAGYVSATITAVNPTTGGYLSVYPCDENRPSTSSLNFRPNENTNGTVYTKISSSGTVCIFANSTTDVVFDINGYYPLSSGYTSLNPASRFLDTRSNGQGLNTAGSTKQIQISGVGGVPATVDSVNLNIISVGSSTAGNLIAFPCDITRPSNISLPYSASVANSTTSLYKLSKDGKICIYTSTATNLVVDVNGYFSSTGPYISTPEIPTLLNNYSVAGDSIVQQINLTSAIGAKGINGLLTINAPKESGLLTVYPCDKPILANTINGGGTVNYIANTTKTVPFISGVSSTGTICIKSLRTVSVTINTLGYFSSSSSFVSTPNQRLLDTRKNTVIQASFQNGVREIYAKAYDVSGKSSTTPVAKITF